MAKMTLKGAAKKSVKGWGAVLTGGILLAVLALVDLPRDGTTTGSATADGSTGCQLQVTAADRAGIGNSRYNTANDVLEHPHLAARGRWAEVGTPNGPVPALRPPVDSTTWGSRMDPVPAVGEPTDRILAGLGLSPADVGRLRAAGAV